MGEYKCLDIFKLFLNQWVFSCIASKYISMINQECKIRSQILNINSDNSSFDP